MKQILTLLLVAITTQLLAQTNPITAINITLPQNPDANVANWGTGTSLFTIGAVYEPANGRIDPAVEESRILVIIKRDGKKVCGAYTSSTAPVAGFKTTRKVWSGTNAVALLGKECSLAAGKYELTVQFFSYVKEKIVAVSNEQGKAFVIKETRR